MRRAAILTAVVLCCLLLRASRPAAAQTPDVAAAGPPGAERIVLSFEKYQLENGLEVILHRDGSLPLVAVNVWYHVGPVREPPGRSGFAHLFEHLMFEGSEHAGDRFDALLEAAGASNVNGTTSWDRTNYFETVPREHLELALWLESDRMGFLLAALTKQRFLVQRRVVINERHEVYDNAPYGPSTLRLYQTLFPPGHPYHGAIIGSLQDLTSATLEDAHRFYQDFYAPGNATLAIVGDFESPQVKRLVHKYFASLPARSVPTKQRAQAAVASRSRRVVVPEPVEVARVRMGWITPPAYTSDEPALDLATLILAGGKATRLYRKLVVEQKLAAKVSAYLDANELCSIAVVDALARTDAHAEQLEQALDAVLGGLAKTGPTARELARAKRHRLVDLLSELQQLNGPGGESGRAGLLQRFNHYLGDPGYLQTYLRRLDQVSVSDVQRVVTTHLSRRGRVVVITEPRQPPPARPQR